VTSNHCTRTHSLCNLRNISWKQFLLRKDDFTWFLKFTLLLRYPQCGNDRISVIFKLHRVKITGILSLVFLANKFVKLRVLLTKLIWRNSFLVRENFLSFHTVPHVIGVWIAEILSHSSGFTKELISRNIFSVRERTLLTHCGNYRNLLSPKKYYLVLCLL